MNKSKRVTDKHCPDCKRLARQVEDYQERLDISQGYEHKARTEIERLREERDNCQGEVARQWHESKKDQRRIKALCAESNALRARLEDAVELENLDLYQALDGQYVAAYQRNGEWIRATGTDIRPALESLEVRLRMLRGKP